jgi:hypothetical protein
MKGLSLESPRGAFLILSPNRKQMAMTYAETVFLFVSVVGFSGVWCLLYSIRQELEAIRLSFERLSVESHTDDR